MTPTWKISNPLGKHHAQESRQLVYRDVAPMWEVFCCYPLRTRPGIYMIL